MASSSAASLPIIDISPFLSPTPDLSARRATTDALAAACRDFGFFYLTGHGVTEARRQGVLDAARAFFRHGAPAEKAAIRRQDAGRGAGDGARGYQVLAENVTQGKRDWHEALDLYRPVVDGEGLLAEDLLEREETDTETAKGRDGDGSKTEHSITNGHVSGGDGNDPDAGKRLTLDLRPGQTGTRRRTPFALLEGVNVWPSRPAGFRALLEEYAATMQAVGTAVLRALGEALGLRDADAFVAATRRSFWVMRVIGYPPLDRELAAAGGVSCGAHTDYGCLTLLLADATRGALQVLRRRPARGHGGDDGEEEQEQDQEEWISADPVPGAYVVNVGDMVEKWTNGLVRSTLHRVVHTGENYRVSIPFFLEPDRDAWVEPLEECVQATGGVRKEGGVRYGDHLAAKVGGNFYGGGSGQDQSDSVS